MDLILLFFFSISPYYPKEGPGPGALLPIFLIIFYSILYLSIIFYSHLIRPRMREFYKDSGFLKSLSKQALLYIVVALFYQFYYWVFVGMG
jgi:hypothetical protein